MRGGKNSAIVTKESNVHSHHQRYRFPQLSRCRRDGSGGFPYYWAVNYGRVGFTVKNAKALRFVLPNGQVIFRHSVGPAAARDILGKSVTQLDSSAINAVATSGAIGYGASVRRWFATFLSKFAYFQAQAMGDATPNGPGGKLASSYRSTIAT
jgi:hypothetical protein